MFEILKQWKGLYLSDFVFFGNEAILFKDALYWMLNSVCRALLTVGLNQGAEYLLWGSLYWTTITLLPDPRQWRQTFVKLL